MAETSFAIDLELEDGYRFTIDFGQDGVDDLVVDEPPPLGEGAGTNPARLLAAAVGSCMSASLKFCLGKARIDVSSFRTRVEATLVRNERGRLRVGGLRVRLEPGIAAADRDRIRRCLDVFEDFCIVGQSVREGVPLEVEVEVAPAVAEPAAAAAAGD